MTLKDHFPTDRAAYYFMKLQEWKLCDWDIEAVFMKCHPTVTLSQANYRTVAPSIYQNQKRDRRTSGHTDISFKSFYLEHKTCATKCPHYIHFI